MRTRAVISAIVMAIVAVLVTGAVALVWWLGWTTGLGVALVVAVLLLAAYFEFVRPWHLRWGATDIEIARTMPGDDLLPNAASVTRAVTIEAHPEAIWPWLVQLGSGKAGWYSYDWIDNDGRPSADHILPEHQRLEIGDTISMMPALGLEVRSIDPQSSIVSMLPDGSTSWCLALYRLDDRRTRLISRWRPMLDRSPASMAMRIVVEPGTFIMEQKMLRTIRDRVESAHDGTEARA